MAGLAVVVTGAGGGLGAAYARHLAARGDRVVVNDVDPTAAGAVAAEVRSAGGTALACPGDVADWGFAAALVARCTDAFGRIDGLVNNAGALVADLAEAAAPADVERMVRVNLIGTFASGQAAVRAMLAQGGGGAIVNVTSGSQAGDPGLSAYGATKGAVASLTYAWAREFRDRGIRVNAVSPLAATRMAAAFARWAVGQGQAASALPAPEVSAPLVGFLLSPAAAGVTGQVVRLAGRSLCLVSHPRLAAPVLDGDWTEAAIARAFAEVLAARQVPLGLAPPVEDGHGKP
ncbi:MAG: SDR family oxidoreductase [Rhodobacteraceae bacterium]|jgi:NAD(P)-dependent dehydrogenase (short-subunit alcohol dehydrogenase family)|nr:SDR family oxidoreductase [Paracoccaceae bacterium]